MLLVDSIFSDYTATCLSVYQSHSKSLSFHEVSNIVQNQYAVRVLCYLTGDTSMACPLVSVTLCRRKKIHPVLGLDFVEAWEVGSPWGLWHFFGSSSGSLHLAPLVCSPGGLRHPMPQQTWPDRSYGGSSSSELLPAPSSALSVLKHLLHVQFSTALNSGKSKPILTGTLQDTSLQWGLSICLINSDLLPPAALALKLFFKNKWVATIFFFIDVEKKNHSLCIKNRWRLHANKSNEISIAGTNRKISDWSIDVQSVIRS